MKNLTVDQWNKKALKQIEGFVKTVNHADQRDKTHSKITLTLCHGRIYYKAEKDYERRHEENIAIVKNEMGAISRSIFEALKP